MNLLRANNDEGVRGVESESQHPRAIRRLYAGSPGAASQYCVNLCPDESDTETIICEAMNNISEPIRQRLPAARTTAVLESLVEQPTGVPFHQFSRDPTDAAFLLSTRSGRPIVYLRPVPIVPLRASASLMPLSLHVRQILAGNLADEPIIFRYERGVWVDDSGVAHAIHPNGLPVGGEVLELERPAGCPVYYADAVLFETARIAWLSRYDGLALELYRIEQPELEAILKLLNP
jgi:hypothetical protein